MKKWIPDIICGLFILLFAYTALSKIFAFSNLKFVLSTAPLIRNYAFFIAPAIPAVELIIALLLFIPQTTKFGLKGAVSLMFAFTGYLIFMVITEPNLFCTCGGVLEQMTWKQHIGFNILFIVLGITGIYFHSEKRITENKTKNENRETDF